MKKLIVAGITLLTGITTANAQWFGKDKIKGNGNVVTVERNTSEYNEVSVSGFFDVELVAGVEGKISVTGEENLISHIITEVKQDELIIEIEKGYNLQPSFNKTILITVPFKSLNAVSLAGSGDVVGKDLITTENFKAALSGSGDLSLKVNTTKIKSHLTGSGDLRLQGTTTDFECSLVGSGDIDAERLKAVNADATISGSGDIDLHCDGTLKARISGSGNVECHGNPTREDSKISGSGNVSKA